MSQTNECGCGKPSVKLPVTGLELYVDAEALECGCDGTKGGIDYSLEEQWTGKHWIDGKKIYQKTVASTVALPKNTEVTIPHGIANVERFITYDGIFGTVDAHHLPHIAINGSSVGSGAAIAILVDLEMIRLKAFNFDRAGSKSFFTLQYVCKDR